MGDSPSFSIWRILSALHSDDGGANTTSRSRRTHREHGPWLGSARPNTRLRGLRKVTKQFGGRARLNPSLPPARSLFFFWLSNAAMNHIRPLQVSDPEAYALDFYSLPGQMPTLPSLSSEKHISLKAGAHLRDPLGRYKAGGFYDGESCFRKHVYHPDFHWSRYDTLQWTDEHQNRQISQAGKQMASESSACQF